MSPAPDRGSAWLGMLLPVLLVLAGCTGALVDAMEQRHLASCIWWSGPFARGVSATGGVDVATCLAQRHTWP